MINISFYWADDEFLAASDAFLKGIPSNKWTYLDTPKEFDIEKYDAVYFQTGNILMEQFFAKIQKRDVPKWLC